MLHEDKTYSRQHYCLIQEGDELAVLLYEDVIDTQNEDKYLFLSGGKCLIQFQHGFLRDGFLYINTSSRQNSVH